MSDTPCALSGTTPDGPIIQQGLCSTATESLLLEEDCINYVWNNQWGVWETIFLRLMKNM